MFIPVGLALGALSTVSSLVESAASSVAKAGGNDPLSSLAQAFSGEQSQTNPPTGTPPAGQFDSGTLATLISLQGQDGKNAASGLFAKIDTDGDGAISKNELETALSKVGIDTTSADAVFNKLDANGDGSISTSELASARGAVFRHPHPHVGGGLASLLNSNSADGSTTQTTTNADGSTTTTVTYADGSTVSTTTPATSQDGGSSGSNTGRSSGNLLEKLIQLQSMLISHSTPTTTAVA